MFDRLVSFTDSNLTIGDVTSNLNILDYDTYFNLSSFIKNKDIPGILTKYNDIFSQGFDDVNFLNEEEFIKKQIKELQRLLEETIAIEDYENASEIQKNISQLKGKLD